MFLNDGLETWSGLDLDRMLGVKALLDWNRKNDPVFNDWDTASFARRYTVGERRVTEVVHLLPLRLHDLGLFLCAANAAWASPYVVGEPWRQTETAVLELFLLDRMIEQDETIFYMLDISPNGSVKAGFDHALRLMERFHRRPRPQSGTAS
jgi:hypothetical protein